MFARATLSLIAAAIAIVPAVFAADVPVDVGATGNTFSPETVTAAVGDTVVFTFRSPTHTVTQASQKLAGACISGGGFNSAVQPSGATYNYTVASADSVYVFCLPHCAAGMVMIINPGPSDSVATYKGVASGAQQPLSFPNPVLPPPVPTLAPVFSPASTTAPTSTPPGLPTSSGAPTGTTSAPRTSSSSTSGSSSTTSSSSTSSLSTVTIFTVAAAPTTTGAASKVQALIAAPILAAVGAWGLF